VVNHPVGDIAVRVGDGDVVHIGAPSLDFDYGIERLLLAEPATVFDIPLQGFRLAFESEADFIGEDARPTRRESPVGKRLVGAG
jgi:hypothetical protein